MRNHLDLKLEKKIKHDRKELLSKAILGRNSQNHYNRFDWRTLGILVQESTFPGSEGQSYLTDFASWLNPEWKQGFLSNWQKSLHQTCVLKM